MFPLYIRPIGHGTRYNHRRASTLPHGKTEFEYPNVATIKQLIRAFSEEFPEIKPHLEESAAFAIDGQLFRNRS